MKTKQDFHDAYLKLSDLGQCDEPGGSEYRQVLQEWLSSGCPSPIEQFIVTRANTDSQGRGRATLN